MARDRGINLGLLLLIHDSAACGLAYGRMRICHVGSTS